MLNLIWKTCTPVKAAVFKPLLEETGYPPLETEFIVNGFSTGFSLCYEEPNDHTQRARNLPLKVRTLDQIWQKLEKKISLGRVVGPFDSIPYDTCIQSPIGLVRKDQNDVHLIFHLCHLKFSSVNYYIPEHLCKVRYKDLDHAVRMCIKEGQNFHVVKSYMKSTDNYLSGRRIGIG